eukprot:10429939-Lingulodinium_polyedra.AAC.1
MSVSACAGIATRECCCVLSLQPLCRAGVCRGVLAAMLRDGGVECVRPFRERLWRVAFHIGQGVA